MVDISHKPPTKRRAIASSSVRLGAKAFRALVEEASPKGNVLEAAKIAAIMAAKNAPQLIPMCHPLNLNQVLVDFKLDQKKFSVHTTVEVNLEAKTGAEMEALLAASVASLTIYDMLKWVDKGMVIEATQLLFKSGGKSGDYSR